MVSYGGGANSTALLIGLHQHRIPVDLILFADTGAEHPHTYAYLEVMDRWLKDHGMPPIIRVYKTTRDGKRLTLEDECLQSCSLPSIAYGFKRCSLKHKIGPQEKFCNHYPPCQKAWAAGKRVVKFIGYDAGEGYRSDKVLLGDLADRKYSNYDEIEICGSAASSHPKGAFQIRNRQMVKRSDLVVFYVDHTGGGAYQTMRYAQKEKKNILNLAGEGYGEKE